MEAKRILKNAAETLVDRMIEEFQEGLDCEIGNLGNQVHLKDVPSGDLAAMMVAALREAVGKKHDEIEGSFQLAQEVLWEE